MNKKQCSVCKSSPNKIWHTICKEAHNVGGSLILGYINYCDACYANKAKRCDECRDKIKQGNSSVLSIKFKCTECDKFNHCPQCETPISKHTVSYLNQ